MKFDESEVLGRKVREFSKVNVPIVQKEDEEKIIVAWEDDTVEQQKVNSEDAAGNDHDAGCQQAGGPAPDVPANGDVDEDEDHPEESGAEIAGHWEAGDTSDEGDEHVEKHGSDGHTSKNGGSSPDDQQEEARSGAQNCGSLSDVDASKDEQIGAEPVRMSARVRRPPAAHKDYVSFGDFAALGVTKTDQQRWEEAKQLELNATRVGLT